MKGVTIMSENKYHSFSDSEFGFLDVFQFGDKFWFPASDCALKLGYFNPRDAIKRHCTGHGVVKHDVIFPYKNSKGTVSEIRRSINLIDEGNLYRLIVKSQLESAIRFETWVFDMQGKTRCLSQDHFGLKQRSMKFCGILPKYGAC